MDKEEPAWRAELRAAMRDGLESVSEIAALVEPHIKAAEERGRREALKEVAAKLREEIEALEPDDNWAVYYRISDVKSLPNLIDPDFS